MLRFNTHNLLRSPLVQNKPTTTTTIAFSSSFFKCISNFNSPTTSFVGSTSSPFIFSTRRFQSTSSSSNNKTTTTKTGTSNKSEETTEEAKPSSTKKTSQKKKKQEEEEGDESTKATTESKDQKEEPKISTADDSATADAVTTSTEKSASTAAEAATENKKDVAAKKKEDEENTELSIDLEVEPMRWNVPAFSEEIVDEKGQYIVSKQPWKTGELAYTTPAPPAPHEARFGYQVVVVKKPQSYWSWYRRHNFFSFTHLWYQMAFAIAFCWLLTFIQLETNYLYSEMRRPGNVAADQLGKGDANRHQKKITVTPEERDQVLNAMQSAFLDGKDLTSKGSKDYRMKKIPRPKEFKAEDYMRGASPKF